MVFADLRMGDWFEWNRRIYIRLKDMIMSLNKDDFGTLYSPLYSEQEVKYITVFDYDVSTELEKFNKTKNLNTRMLCRYGKRDFAKIGKKTLRGGKFF